MMKTFKPVLFILAWFSMSLSLSFGADDILPLDKVTKGMKGRGLSVFADNKIEEFDVEIIGVLRNFQPKRSLILARLASDVLSQSGVIQGMSGSPVYVNGKIIGAVAYSYPFAKEAIAGITPIEEMLAVSQPGEPKMTFSARIPIQKHLSMEELLGIYKGIFPPSPSGVIDGQVLSPLHIPLVFSGFPAPVFEGAKPFFQQMGFVPVLAGTSSQTGEKVSLTKATLREGDSVGAQLVTGDLSLSAVGTVTYVDGNRVLAFGHPLYNLGRVGYLMTKENVLAVVPSLSTSFKISTPGEIVGMFSQDRSSGVIGELGKMPPLVPLNIKLVDPSGTLRDYKLNVVADKILTPFLVNVAVSGVLAVEARSLGDLSLTLDGRIYLDNGMNVQLEDLFSGTFDSSLVELSSLITAVVFFLTNNDFKELGIHRIDLTVSAAEEVRFTYLEKVWLEKYDASPGEMIPTKIYIRHFNGQGEVKEGIIPVPQLPSGSVCNLIIADSQSLRLLETSQYRSRDFIPRSIEQLIRLLNNLRKNNRIYFKIIASKPGLFLKGEELPNLPPTMKSMFSSSRVATAPPTELDQSTLSYFQLPVGSVFKGSAVIPIRIK